MLDNILRFDNPNFAGGMEFKPGKGEDDTWTPLMDIGTFDATGEISDEVTEVPNDGYETIHATARIVIALGGEEAKAPAEV